MSDIKAAIRVITEALDEGRDDSEWAKFLEEWIRMQYEGRGVERAYEAFIAKQHETPPVRGCHCQTCLPRAQGDA